MEHCAVQAVTHCSQGTVRSKLNSKVEESANGAKRDCRSLESEAGAQRGKGTAAYVCKQVGVGQTGTAVSTGDPKQAL